MDSSNSIYKKYLKTDLAKRIIKEIENWIEINSILIVDYGRWYCGITNNPPTRKSAHRHNISAEPYAWKDFNASSRKMAEILETYFHNLGMKDHDTKGGSKPNSKFIYVYKLIPTTFDKL